MNLLFPIETISRELDYKLILACLALKDNPFLNVFLGSVPAIHSHRDKFKNGLYFGKTVFTKLNRAGNEKSLSAWKARGFDILYLHEEGGVWPGNEENWKANHLKLYDPQLFDSSDIICLWGEYQEELDRNRTQGGLQFRVTGNPRFDLLRNYQDLFSTMVEDLRKEFGDFVLINGKYARVNHGESFRKVQEGLKLAKGDPTQGKLDSFSLLRSQANKMYAMVELIVNLATRMPEVNFVMRPHPSEGLSLYEDFFFDLPNVFVERKGSANAYMLASKAVIHDGCTTSVEASNSNILIINYGVESDQNDFLVPSEVGVKAKTIDDCKMLIEKSIQGEGVIYKNHFSDKSLALVQNLKPSYNSFEALRGLIDNHFKENGEYYSGTQWPSDKELKSWYRKDSLRIKGSRIKNTLLNNQAKLKRDAYHKNKFQGLDQKELANKLEILNQKLGSNVQLGFLNSEIIKLYVGDK